MGFATTAAIVGMASTAATTGMSFAQAGKQRRLQSQAQSEAAEAMAAARKKLDVNFYEQLAIQKEPYELAREAALVQGAEALQAGVEGEQRGAAATAGRVQMAQQQGQRQIAAAMGQEMLGLEKATAAEESRLRDMGIGLDIQAARGAQLAARDAQEAANLATKQGMEGIVSMGQQVAAAAPLYAKTQSARLASGISKSAQEAGFGQADMQRNVASLGSVGGIDLTGVSSMTPLQYQDFMSSQSPSVLKQIEAKLPNVYSSPIRPMGYNLPTQNYGLGFPVYNIPAVGGQ